MILHKCSPNTLQLGGSKYSALYLPVGRRGIGSTAHFPGASTTRANTGITQVKNAIMNMCSIIKVDRPETFYICFHCGIETLCDVNV